jgi:Zn-dependent protease
MLIPAVIQFLILIFAISIHEFFHGLIAYRLGDPTAKEMGRLTLNPFAHIDIFGTILLPLILVMLNLPPVGWARPVPVNFLRLKNLKRDILWVGIVGPIANLLLAVLLIAILKLLPAAIHPLLSYTLIYAIIINIVLAVFNLVPIPPLDGSRIITAILPYRYSILYNSLQSYGFIIILVMAWSGLLRKSISFILAVILNYLGITIP